MENSLTQIQLGGRKITRTEMRPFVIAEVGVNHECSLDRAKKMIDQAQEGGADSVKFQAYKARTISVKDSPAYWDRTQEPTATQFELFKKFDHFGPNEYEVLARHCQDRKIDFSCTPFDFASANFLFDLVSFYKISSSDLTNVPFLRHIAKKGKPVVLSTGASYLSEIDLAVRTIRDAGNVQLALLHCVLNYPCSVDDAHLRTIRHLRETYLDLVVGYSDHVPPDPRMLTLTYAFLEGATILEKHFTDDKTLKGNDHYHSMTKEDLRVFRENIDFYHRARGQYHKTYLSNEAAARKNARRSVVAAVNLRAGDVITEEKLTYKRPAHGISPVFIDYLIGAKMKVDVAEDTPLCFEHIESLIQPED